MSTASATTAPGDASGTTAPAGGGAGLHLRGITKRFADFTAVDALDLDVPEGSFFALLGPSGCGKTTTLRIVAGLEDPTMGTIHIGETDVTRSRPYQRPVNTVFQSYALFPHMTIFENVAFGLRRRKQAEVKTKVMQMLELVELDHLAQRKPTQLSGGQQQRIALVRALVNRPKVLLLDEPLGALDLKLRRQMQLELKRIQTEVGITFIHVTHDQEEAMTMADTIAVMNLGRIEQLGPPVDLYENPSSAFVANFLGQSNLLPAKVIGSDASSVQLECAGGTLQMPRNRAAADADSVFVGVRPEKLQLAEGEPPSGTNTLSGTVIDASFIGVSTQYVIRLPDGNQISVFSQNSGAGTVLPGTDVTAYWLPAHTFSLDAGQDVTAGLSDEGE
jgi:spermidine/putrescine transport system ATP-binding protein